MALERADSAGFGIMMGAEFSRRRKFLCS